MAWEKEVGWGNDREAEKMLQTDEAISIPIATPRAIIGIGSLNRELVKEGAPKSMTLKSKVTLKYHNTLNCSGSVDTKEEGATT